MKTMTLIEFKTFYSVVENNKIIADITMTAGRMWQCKFRGNHIIEHTPELVLKRIQGIRQSSR